MSLPYSYSYKIELPDSENASLEEVLWEMFRQLKESEMVKELSIDKKIIRFTYKSLFTISYPLALTFSRANNIKIEYEIKLVKLIQVCIGLAIFIAFFSRFEIRGYLVFCAIFILFFFGLNLIFTNNLIIKLIESTNVFSNINQRNEGLIGDEQKKWIKDVAKCPACGEDINEFDLKCPDCGIRIRNSAAQSPFDVSKYKTKRFKYHYKETKKQ